MEHGMNDSLKDDLAALAGRTETVDLMVQAHRVARRLKATRAAVAGIAVAVVAGGAALGVTALPGGGSPILPADSGSSLDGTVLLSSQGPVGDHYTAVTSLATWHPGNRSSQVLLDREPIVAGSTASSPDGRYVSYVDDGGVVRVVETDTGEQVALPEQVPSMIVATALSPTDAHYSPPTWAPDSRRLWVDSVPKGDKDTFVDVVTGDITLAPSVRGQATKVISAPDGSDAFLSLGTTDSGHPLTSTTETGDTTVLLPQSLERYGTFTTNLYSADATGSRLCLQTLPEIGDEAPEPGCAALVRVDDPTSDPVTYRVDALESVDGDPHASAMGCVFVSGFDQRVHQFSDSINLTDGDGTVLDTAPLPDVFGPETESTTVLGYTP